MNLEVLKELLENATNLIIDVCAMHEGKCAECELNQFCQLSKPMDANQDWLNDLIALVIVYQRNEPNFRP